MTTIRLTVILIAAFAVAGCGMTRASRRPPAPIAVVKPVPPEVLAPKRGSIWQTTDRNTLFLDNKARNVGDIVTVSIFEKSNAENDATTELSRENKNRMNLTGMFNLKPKLAAAAGLALPARAASLHTFEGDGNTTRKSELKATISCVVTEVLSNGNLRIEGRRDITINHENQFILLSGVIRPEDISQNNSVTSAQIADARIDYSGDGDIDEQQRPSWINRFFSTVNLL